MLGARNRFASSRLAGALVLLTGVTLAATSPAKTNPDVPRHGRWDLAPRQIWRVAEVQGQPFQVPAELRVASDGTLFLRDFPRDRSYIFAGDGSFVRAVAPTGDQPGQVTRYLNCFPGVERMVIAAPDALHFFALQGDFLGAAPNDLFTRFPGVFLSDRRFLCTPGPLTSGPSGTVAITRVDLDTGQSGVFATMSTEGAPAPRADGMMLNVRGLTPAVEMACDHGRGRVYYGRNDRYAIHVTDLDGEPLLTFGIEREPRRVPPEAKRAHFEDFGLPPEQLRDLVASFPDELTFFRRIQVVGDLVFVTATTGIGRHPAGVELDIFSLAGEYLYRAPIRFAGGEHIFGGADNLVIHGDSFYVSLEDTAGHRSVARYCIDLPD